MATSPIYALLAKGKFKKLGPYGREVIPVARKALSDADWKVRRNALRLLDHANDPASTEQIIELLKDEHAAVRKWAAHALGCDTCKSGRPSSIDPVPYLIDAARSDPSLDVRRSATVCLAWNRPPEQRVGSFLSDLARTESDPKILLHAEGVTQVLQIALEGVAGFQQRNLLDQSHGNIALAGIALQ